MRIYDTLDIYQRVSVDTKGNVLCVAGPGSGKTRTLTAKAQELVNARRDVICLTFTRAAAREIQERIPGIPAGTIHSFCHSVVGWEKEEEDLLVRYIQSGKDKFEYVLVDEVQDLTVPQMEVVLSLVGGNIFAVGDPYQSIYRYAEALGADVVPVLQAEGCQLTFLKNNYRSSTEIVDRLNEIYPRGLNSVGVTENGITAILCRRNDDVTSASEILKSHKIGHSVSRHTNRGRRERFYGSKEIRISTIHVAKGLEFSNVILFGWLPDSNRMIPAPYDEQKNIYYVAVSRAVKNYGEAEDEYSLIRLLKRFVPELPKYIPRDDERKPMPRLDPVVFEAEWYNTVISFLSEVKGDKKTVSTARSIVDALATYKFRFQKGMWSQVSFTYPQMKMLISFTEAMQMKEAYERFRITIREEVNA